MATSWKDIEIHINKTKIKGIRNFKYNITQQTELIYAEGNMPVGVGYGQIQFSGQITLLQSELEQIISASDNKPLNVTFNVIFSYVNNSGKIITDVCVGCRFKSVEKELEQGNTFMEITLPLTIQRILFNTTI